MSDNKQVVAIDGVSTRELVNDVVAITFESTKEGKIADTVQQELRESVRAAIELVTPHIKTDEVDVSTDSFQVQPRYNKAGKMDGYLGIAQVTVKGTDTATIAQLASDIKTMVVSSSKNSMSRKLKQSVETDLMKDAIADFSMKADAVAQAFGYKSWELGQVSVGVQAERSYGGGGKVMALSASAGMESAPMSVESGKSTMNGYVRGNIVLSRSKKA